MVSNATFVQLFDQLVIPTLSGLGFREVLRPDGWMAPERLFEREDRWFGASWDWRDRFFEAELGKLYLFDDVMPSVIIRGPYRHTEFCTGQEVEQCLADGLARVAQELPHELERLEGSLAESLRKDLLAPLAATKKQRQVVREYASRVGESLTLGQWEGATLLR